MKADNRLSSVLHVLLHMIELDEPLTSDELSQMLTSHPVVVRRTLAGLRDAGLVPLTGSPHGATIPRPCELRRLP